MYSLATRRAGRAQGRGAVREISIPLPLRGVFVTAKTAEIPAVYAAKLENLRSDGTLLELRREAILGAADQLAMQRVPFEFGDTPRYIELRTDRAQCAGAEYLRPFSATVMAAYISSHAVLADGLGDPVVYDGTAFAAGAFSTTTGVDQDQFDGVVAHHDRLYFWRSTGALEFYYGDLGAITGPLTRFPLDRLGNITGRIVAMIPLTIDAGINTNDVLCIFTSTGWAVIYGGNDPGDPDDWTQVTKIKIAPPLSRFAAHSVGSDVWVATSVGVVSMADTFNKGVLALVSSFSRPIVRDMLALALTGQGEWQLHTAADGSHVIVNHWDGSAGTQFIYDTESQSWTTANMAAKHWHNLVLDTEFTHSSQRLATFERSEDPDELITAVWHSSWFRLGRGGQIAYLTPTIIARGPLAVTVTVLSDHDETQVDIDEATQTVTIEPDNPLDAVGRVALNERIAVGAVGDVFQLRMEITATWAQIVDVTAGVI